MNELKQGSSCIHVSIGNKTLDLFSFTLDKGAAVSM